jgi:DNA-binding GntR family transcriptional regulator
MATHHSPADDLVYDLVSVQYHALKAAQAYDRYVDDAHDHDDVRDFFEACARQDAERAQRCHHFLGRLTKAGGLGGR